MRFRRVASQHMTGRAAVARFLISKMWKCQSAKLADKPGLRGPQCLDEVLARLVALQVVAERENQNDSDDTGYGEHFRTILVDAHIWSDIP